MRVVNGFPSWCRLILTLVACAGSVGCTRNLVCKDALMALPKAQELVAHVPDVAIAVISQEGHVFPKRLIVRQNLHAIVWVANADSLTIRFPSGEIRPECTGAVCVAMPPTMVSEGDGFSYGGSVTKNGVTKELDPRLEVVR